MKYAVQSNIAAITVMATIAYFRAISTIVLISWGIATTEGYCHK